MHWSLHLFDKIQSLPVHWGFFFAASSSYKVSKVVWQIILFHRIITLLTHKACNHYSLHAVANDFICKSSINSCIMNLFEWHVLKPIKMPAWTLHSATIPLLPVLVQGCSPCVLHCLPSLSGSHSKMCSISLAIQLYHNYQASMFQLATTYHS